MTHFMNKLYRYIFCSLFQQFKKLYSCIKSFIIFSKSDTLDLDKNITIQLLHVFLQYYFHYLFIYLF